MSVTGTVKFFNEVGMAGGGQRLQPRYWRRRRGRGGWIVSVSPVLTGIADVNVARNSG
jgi:hypothetical protein